MDGRPNRRNKAAFSKFPGVLLTRPELYELSKLQVCILRVSINGKKAELGTSISSYEELTLKMSDFPEVA